MIQLLDSVPWFVITAFAATAAIALAAGRRRSADEARPPGSATRIAGAVYTVAVAVVVLLWVREQWT